ncbi:MAG TPA: MarR family transcriptional regulator [Acidobacteriota bacterium]|nr:MarR family transcriptional regulator [Acidobacteriota bacterium]
MSDLSQRRIELLVSVNQIMRKITAQSVMISHAVATRAGIHGTDMECLDLLHFEGPMTPGRLSALTGLTTGAMTMVIDRLERRGLARRVPNPADRRSVFVEALPVGFDVIAPFFEPLAQSMDELYQRYSDEELKLVLDYLTRAYSAGSEHLQWLKDKAPVEKEMTHGK